MLSHLEFRGWTPSRRRFVSGLSVAVAASSTVVLAATAARADKRDWQEYRDEEIGFRFELPGKFKYSKYPPRDETFIGDGHLEAEFAEMDMDVIVLAKESRDELPTEMIDYLYELLRAGAPATGNLPSREEEITVSGVPACDFIREADKVNYIYRLVIVDHRVIVLYLIGGRRGTGGRSVRGNNPTVRRILDSLTLLRGGS
jgi:hypothetical protein